MFDRFPSMFRSACCSGAVLVAMALAPVVGAHGPEEHGTGKPAAGGAVPGTLPAGHGQPRGEKVQLQGELVDLVCYMQHPESGQGPEHAACARKCMKQGLPPGLLSEGKLYLLMSQGHENYGPTIAEHAGTQVKVEGHLVQSGGMQALVISHLSPGNGEGRGAPQGNGAGPAPHH